MDIETLIRESQEIARRSADLSESVGARAVELARRAQAIQALTRGSASGERAAGATMAAAQTLRRASASMEEMRATAEAYARELMK